MDSSLYHTVLIMPRPLSIIYNPDPQPRLLSAFLWPSECLHTATSRKRASAVSLRLFRVAVRSKFVPQKNNHFSNSRFRASELQLTAEIVNTFAREFSFLTSVRRSLLCGLLRNFTDTVYHPVKCLSVSRKAIR